MEKWPIFTNLWSQIGFQSSSQRFPNEGIKIPISTSHDPSNVHKAPNLFPHAVFPILGFPSMVFKIHYL
jgi:hypothetical protein